MSIFVIDKEETSNKNEVDNYFWLIDSGINAFSWFVRECLLDYLNINHDTNYNLFSFEFICKYNYDTFDYIKEIENVCIAINEKQKELFKLLKNSLKAYTLEFIREKFCCQKLLSSNLVLCEFLHENYSRIEEDKRSRLVKIVSNVNNYNRNVRLDYSKLFE